jgi:hypothetical protein
MDGNRSETPEAFERRTTKSQLISGNGVNQRELSESN